MEPLDLSQKSKVSQYINLNMILKILNIAAF